MEGNWPQQREYSSYPRQHTLEVDRQTGSNVQENGMRSEGREGRWIPLILRRAALEAEGVLFFASSTNLMLFS